MAYYENVMNYQQGDLCISYKMLMITTFWGALASKLNLESFKVQYLPEQLLSFRSNFEDKVVRLET